MLALSLHDSSSLPALLASLTPSPLTSYPVLYQSLTSETWSSKRGPEHGLALHQRVIIVLMTFSSLENLHLVRMLKGFPYLLCSISTLFLFHNVNKSLWANVSSLSVDWKRISVSQLVYSVFILTALELIWCHHFSPTIFRSQQLFI